MSIALTIRDANMADIPSIRHIAHATWPVAYGQLLSGEQLAYMMDLMYSEASLQQQMEKGHRFYLAILNNEPHGFASVSDEGDGTFKLNKLYVLPDTQKTGAGKALLQQTIQYAKENKGTQLLLQVKRDNPSKGFYEKHGFIVTGELDLDIGNGYFMNDYIMSLAL